MADQLFPFPPQDTSHRWPLVMLSFREFSYHFRVAQPVSTRSLSRATWKERNGGFMKCGKCRSFPQSCGW